MAGTGLRGVIDGSFINSLAGVASQGGSPGESLTKALKGGSSSTDQIQLGLRTGAQAFATGIRGLNTIITFLNITEGTLTELGDITDKLIDITTRASENRTSSQGRSDLDRQFQKLANEFQSIVEGAKVGQTEFMTISGLKELFQVFGLSAEDSNSIQEVFEQFVTPEEDDTLASEEIKGRRPVPIPASAFTTPTVVGKSVEFETLFSNETNIRNRPNAYRVLEDLRALREQIDDNIDATTNAKDIIGKNIDLVRAAGFAFLDLSNQIVTVDDADALAAELRERIRADAGAALSQAENLDAIAIAALSLSESDLLKTNKK